MREIAGGYFLRALGNASYYFFQQVRPVATRAASKMSSLYQLGKVLTLWVELLGMSHELGCNRFGRDEIPLTPIIPRVTANHADAEPNIEGGYSHQCNVVGSRQLALNLSGEAFTFRRTFASSSASDQQV